MARMLVKGLLSRRCVAYYTMIGIAKPEFCNGTHGICAVASGEQPGNGVAAADAARRRSMVGGQLRQR